ncbi:MAG: HNH endonuclease [Deltaproteobacteria bacterium]|nr:HNH endonuclease [Deltaproteobacteria bacterium]
MKEILLWRRKLFSWSLPPVLVAFKQPRRTFVDDEDYDWLSQHKWFLMEGSDNVQGYIDSSYVKMHRMIMQRWQPRENPDSWDVRHRDNDKLHNTRVNLEWTLCQTPALKHHRGQQRQKPKYPEEVVLAKTPAG